MVVIQKMKLKMKYHRMRVTKLSRLRINLSQASTSVALTLAPNFEKVKHPVFIVMFVEAPVFLLH